MQRWLCLKITTFPQVGITWVGWGLVDDVFDMNMNNEMLPVEPDSVDGKYK